MHNEEAKPKRKFSSRFKGVSYCKTERTWRARIYIRGEQFHLGDYQTEVEAARAWNAAALARLGPCAKLQVID